MSPPAPATRRNGAIVWMALGLIALAGFAFWLWIRAAVPAPPLTSFDAETQTRRIEVTLEDIQATWTRLMRADGRAYAPVGHLFFVQATPSPCAGVDGATGPFYCARDRTLNFDLGFFAALTPQLRKIEDTGGKLIVANLAAAAVQDQLGILAAVEVRGRTASARERAAMELGLALQADCLTGVWAQDAFTRLGAVPPGRYELAVQGTRRVAEARAGWGWSGQVALDRLGLGDKEEREAAFAAGYAEGRLASCFSSDPAR